MIHGLGGIIKKMCEWDYAEFVARWSYSTYLIHFFIVFGRHLLKEGLEEISHEIMFTSAVSDIIQSFIAGLVLHLTIERPMAYVFMGVLSKKNLKEARGVQKTK
nr:O-acyltransferase like protein-like [Leptinotarsa decemlineata]